MADSEIKIINDELFEEYKKTAVQWNPVLQQLPIRTANDVLKFFTPVTGLRGKRRFGAISGNSQYAPFNRKRVQEASVDIDYRTIETHPGNVIETFSPVDYAEMPWGYNDPVIGDRIKNASTTAMVLIQLAAARGQHIAQCAISGKRNADGDTTLDLCDGIVTIADQEIEEGNISVAKGNLFEINEDITMVNASDIAKEIVFSTNQFLRRENSVLLCPTSFVDAYNESYLMTHSGISYNKQYDQPYVEGSAHKLTLIGVPELDGLDTMIYTQKSNLLYGTDTKTAQSDIMRKDHYQLSWASHLWLGFQYKTIDPRRLRIIKMKKAAQNPPEKQQQGEVGKQD